MSSSAVVLGVFAFTLAGSPGAAPGPRVVEFGGACDASGAVVLDGRRFAVGDDEDNFLRVYDGDKGGAPLRRADVSAALELPRNKKGVARETDIEAATGLGPYSYWLTSHGRKSSGKVDTSRFLFFATDTGADFSRVRLIGKAYRGLLSDLLALESLKPFDLKAAAQRAPKEEGGLNIEGMTAMPDGESILIGFRNPLPEKKALVIALRNPLGVMRGESAKFGEPRLLELGGLGIRSVSWWRDRYLLIGGSPQSGGTSRLFTWDGSDSAPHPVESVDFTGFNPEGFVTWEDREEILVLSDDGTRMIDGVECKRLKDPAKKRFRGIRVRLEELSGGR